MKRNVLYIICGLLVVLCAASCSKESVVSDTYLDVEISTGVLSDYNDQSGSRVDNGYGVDDEDYRLRYTIELWRADGSQVVYRGDEYMSGANLDDVMTHSFRAVAGDYRLLIFADYVDCENLTGHYNLSEGLDQITILDDDYTANDASRDCYGYSEDLTISESFVLGGISLKRIMAKMTLSDISPENVTSGESVGISYSSSIPSGYDLLSGEVITDKAISPCYPTTSAGQTIAYDYIFVSDPTSYLMTFVVGDKEVSATINFEQNKVTNITATFFNTQTE